MGGKVKAMKCLGSNRAWLKQSPWPGQEANFMQLTREDEEKRGEREKKKSFMNSEYPTTQLHHTAICPQQPINWWKGQRVISYLTWRLLMCTEVKHLKWRMRESNEPLSVLPKTSGASVFPTPLFYSRLMLWYIYRNLRLLNWTTYCTEMKPQNGNAAKPLELFSTQFTDNKLWTLQEHPPFGL